MSPLRLIILLVAAGAAIAAVFLVRSIQTPQPAAAAAASSAVRDAIPTDEILIARRPIAAGQFVIVDDLKWQPWPATAPTGSFIEHKANPDAMEKFVGAVARVPLAEGEPVIADRLVKPGTAGFMAAMMTPGMRAVSLEIAPETAAGGFILPNDRVDVIVTREIEKQSDSGDGGMQNVRSDLILSNIRVLAIDAVYGKPAPGEGETPEAGTGQGEALIGTRATLELAEKDATLLASAQKAGDITLSLRSISQNGDPSGATLAGRVYRDGLPTSEEQGVRIYRYGSEGRSGAGRSR